MKQAMTQSMLMEKVEAVPLDALVLDERNARRGNVSAIVDSLREFGQHRAVVAQRGSGRIIAGNHLYMAARTLGWTHIGVFWVDDDDIMAVRRAIADNATGDLAVWDLETLAELIDEVGGDIPGLDLNILDKLNAELEVAKKTDSQPVYPIVPKFSESYNCAIIFATNDIDWAFVTTVLGLERTRSYKNTNVGLSHVITAQQFSDVWRSRTGTVEVAETEAGVNAQVEELEE